MKIIINQQLTKLFTHEKKVIAIDADITKIKQFEDQIIEQNEQIKASIRYALIIQQAILPQKATIDNHFENLFYSDQKTLFQAIFTGLLTYRRPIRIIHIVLLLLLIAQDTEYRVLLCL